MSGAGERGSGAGAFGIADGGGAAAGVGRVGGGDDVALTACLEIGGVCVRGTCAGLICVAALWMSPTFASSTGAPSSLACCESQLARSVNDVRKCVTTTYVPSTSTISKTFAAAAASSARAFLSNEARSAAVPTSREWTITIRPSAVSWAIWLRAPFSVSVFRMRYFAVNSALVIT
jgi:hypothetical protein